jgi:hypothetical protein
MYYIIEASKDGKKWQHMARFKKGQISRWNTPFDETVALKEAQTFKHVRYRDGWIYVRLVIEL